MTISKSCEMPECVSGHAKGNYTSKWGIRICPECRSAQNGGMNPNDKQLLLDAGVPESEIHYNDKGNIIMPHF